MREDVIKINIVFISIDDVLFIKWFDFLKMRLWCFLCVIIKLKIVIVSKFDFDNILL